MGLFGRLLGAIALLGVFASACAPAQPPPVEKARVTFAAKEVHYAPYFVAIEKGYYAQEGIDLEIISAAGNASVAAILAGDAEFTTSPASALSAILKDAPMKVIFSHMDRPNYELWSSDPAIKTLGDLKGKSVAVIGRGDTMEISARLALAKAGQDSDGVAYVALGPGAARLAAIQSGSVAAAVLSLADVEQLKRAGAKGNMLVDVAKDVRMLFNGAATSDKILKERPEFVARFMRATLKGREYARTFKNETLDIVGKYNNKPREANEVEYDSLVAVMTTDGTLPVEAQEADTRVRAPLIGATTIRPASEVYDYSVARRVGEEIKKNGWQPTR
ncbi:MAG: hypothetical protein EPO26_04880 [Chloroflexota bacterium]|nr:MAG: hypothetical protein EPO26_04880 [Chloroflexota bacterium]